MEYTYNVSQRKSKSKSKIRNDKKRQNMGHLRPVPNVSRKEKNYENVRYNRRFYKRVIRGTR